MHSFTFSSNPVRLSPAQWAALAVLLALFMVLFPAAWSRLDGFDPGPDYRFPYEISNDYWLYERWCRRAAATFPCLVLGDSVMWGQYATKTETLTHDLNELVGEEVFANLALDGIHPIAMDGLVRYFGKNVRDRRVIVNLNLLWMSSPKQDFQGQEEFRINHPELVPQLWGRFDCYRPSLDEVVSAAAERNVGFFACMRHVRINCFQNMSIAGWTLENPYGNPVAALSAPVPAATADALGKPVDWLSRGVRKQGFDWVPLDESNQWRFFIRTVATLRARGNSVFVLFIPINPYMQTEESLTRFQGLRAEAETWFREERLPFYCADDLPSSQYADASHPLPEGYAMIARELMESAEFRKWIGK